MRLCLAEGVGLEFTSFSLKLLVCIFNRIWQGASLAILALYPVQTQAQFLPGNTPRSDFWVPDGVVHAILETNGVIYLGGEFSALSPNVPTTAMVNAVNGVLETSFPSINGIIHCAVPDRTGGWFIGGNFKQVGDTARTNLVHLLPDNSVDPTWTADANASVFAIKQIGNVIYVGGEFTEIAGETRRNLAALDVASGRLLTWRFDVCCDLSPDNRTRVTALDGSEGRLYAGGFFNQIDGQSHNLIAAFDLARGTVLAWPDVGFEGSSFVAALKLSENRLYVGGRFVNVGGTERRNIAALDPATGFATGWNPGADGEVLDIAVQGNTIFFGGRFFSTAGQPRFNLAAVDFATGEAIEWAPDPDDTVRKIAVSGDVIYVGGDFSSVGGQPHAGIAALSGDNGSALSWVPVTVGRKLQALSINGDRIIASSLLHRDSKTRRRIAALDQGTGRILDWNPGADNTVFTLAYASNTVFLGGDFLSVADSPRTRVAAIDATTGEPLPWNLNTAGPNGRVWALAIANDRLFAAGGFSSVSGTFAPGLAALDLLTGVPINWRPVPNRSVFALEDSGATLYAAGTFSSVAGQTRRAFGEVNSLAPTATSWNPDVRGSGAVGNVITRHDQTVYIGGTFTNVAGLPRQHLAAVSTANASVRPWAPEFGSPSDSVLDLAATDGAIYVAGGFTKIGGKGRNALAALDPITAGVLDWNPDPAADTGPATAHVVMVGTGAIYAGGQFTTLQGSPHRNFAAFLPSGAPVFFRQPSSMTVQKGGTASFAATVTGAPPLSFQWRHNGTNLPDGLNTLLPFADLQASQSGDYVLIASNAFGTVSSAPTTLLVTDTLGVSRSLANITVSPGTNIQFNIGVTGSPPPRFQWKLNGVPIPGADSALFEMESVNTSDSGIFSVVMFNGIESIESPRAALVVNGVAAANADAFADRTLLAAPGGTVIGQTGAASREPGEPLHAGKPGGHSIWYSWVAPASGVAQFNTRGCAFDTLLAVYTNASVSGTNLIVSDDDSAGLYTSTVAFSADAGREYQIAVDGFAGANGRVVLSWSFEPTPEIQPVILRHPVSLSVTEGATANLSVLARGPSLTYQWRRSGRMLPAGTNASLVITNVRPANVGSYSVTVRSGNFEAISAPASLEISTTAPLVSRDKFQDLFATSFVTRATLDLGSVGRQVLDTTGSGTQTLEPIHGGFPGGASRWLRFQATTNVLLQLDTIGSELDTTLGIYTGTNLNTLTPIAGDNNGAPDRVRSLVRFVPSPGVDYQVAVDGANNAQGRIQLNWQLGVPPVTNSTVITREIRIGTPTVLDAGTFGAAPAPTYQWLFNGTAIPGATNANLALTSFQGTNAGSYSVIASNFAGMATNLVAFLYPAPTLRLNHRLVTIGGLPRAQLTGPLTNQVAIDATTNLRDWSQIRVFNHVMPLDFTDLDPRNLPTRFYRATLTSSTDVVPQWLAGNGLNGFRLRGALERQLIIERSTTLESWVPLLTNEVSLNLDFIDPASTNLPARFYRIRPIP